MEEEVFDSPPRYIDCPECGLVLRHRPGHVYGCVCGAFVKAIEVVEEPEEKTQPVVDKNAEINIQYGHAETCLFGTKNSGMCDCGKGFE